MTNKRNAMDTSRNADRRLKELRESIEKFSQEHPDMADRHKRFFEQLESVMPELIAKNATDEEIDVEKFDLMVKHIAPSLNLGQDLPPILCDARQKFSAASLCVYAQVYYKILEVVSSSPVAYADFLLNQYYLHAVKNIKYVLSLDELKDFTGEFDPPEHVLPSSGIRDVGWEDGIGPCTEDFVASTQTFLNELDSSDDEAAGVALFVKWLHTGIEPIFEKIEEYRQRTKKYFDGLMGNLRREQEETEKPGKRKEQEKKRDNEVHQSNHQSNVPYEISLLEEIADKLESWAEERKTRGESKIEEARVRFNNQDSWTVLDDPLDTYFAVPHLSVEFDFVVKTFQSENNFAPATMLVEIQNDFRRCAIEIWQLTLQALEHFSSYDPESDEYESWLSSIRTFSAVTIPHIAKRVRKIAELTKKKMASGKPVIEPIVMDQKDIWGDTSREMKKAIQDYWKESKAKKSEGKRLLIEKFCRKRGLNERTFRSEKDRIETRRKRIRKAH